MAVSETTVIVAGVLGVFLALGFAIAFWAFNKYKTSFVRAYQRNELGISDPIGQDLKALAMKMAQLENEIDDSADSKTAAHVKSHIKMKQELVKGWVENYLDKKVMILLFPSHLTNKKFNQAF